MSGTNKPDERAVAQAAHEDAQYEAHMAALERERGFYEQTKRPGDIKAVDAAMKAAKSAHEKGRETAVSDDTEKAVTGNTETAVTGNTETR